MMGFWRSDIQYTVRRLLPADLKAFANTRLVENDVVFDTSSNPFSEEFAAVKNEKYGGIDVTPFLVYNGYEKRTI